MKVLARVGPDSRKRAPIVHHVTQTGEKIHAFCSPNGCYPAEGDTLKGGAVWTVREWQDGDELCANCQARKEKLDNPPGKHWRAEEKAQAEQERLGRWNAGEARR